jgi:uncharacterized membrane protein YkvI
VLFFVEIASFVRRWRKARNDGNTASGRPAPTPLPRRGIKDGNTISGRSTLANVRPTPAPLPRRGILQKTPPCKIPQEIVQKETPQEVIRKGTPQEVIRKEIPQEIIRKEIPQEIIRKDIPQEIIRKGTPQEVIRKGTPQEVIRKETPQEVIRKEIPQELFLGKSDAGRRRDAVRKNSEAGKFGDFFDIFPKKYAVVLRAAFLISSFITLAAMTAGAERIFEVSFDIKYIGIVSLVPSVFLGFLNTEKLKSVFSALVLAVVGLIVVLFAGSGTNDGYSGFNFLKAVSYASMNVFLGGYLVAKKTDAKRSEIVWTGIFSALILTALLFMIYNINFEGSGDMPVISAAASLGRGRAAAVIVFFAVVSTTISTAKTLLGFAKKRYGTAVSAAAVIACAYLISLAGFHNIVKYTYPAISLFSSLFTVLTLIYLIKHIYGGKKTELLSNIPIPR